MITGSTGRISRTLIFNALMLVVDVIVVNIQLLEELMTNQQFAVLFITLGSIQKVGNMVLRKLTTGPLQ